MRGFVYSPSCQDREAGLFYCLRRNPSLVELKLRRGLGDCAGTIQATEDLYFMTTVQYRDVVGFPGYRVGDDGSIWSRWRNGGNDRAGQVLTDTWHRLKGWIDKRRGKSTGYVKVGLMREGQLYRLRVHRIVLEAFVGPCPEGMESRHLDDDKENNALSNLLWGTQEENAQDRLKNNITLTGERHPRAKLKFAQIPEVRFMLDNGVPRRQIAAHFKVSKGAIDSINRGDTWKEVPL